MKRKNDAMRQEYGTDYNHKCGECSNFVSGRYHDRILQKCEGYGLKHAEASDWAQKWTACGMFNKSFEGKRPLIECLTRPAADATPIDGQIELFGG